MNPVVLLLPIAFAAAPLGASLTGADGSAPAAPVTLGAEAWYSSPQLCLIPQICLPISSPLAATYPAGTLHIAAAAGNESARVYLSLRRPLPVTSTVAGGVLRLPLDTSPLDGSVAPDLAKVKACTTRAPIKVVEGSTAKPPATDCTDAPTSRVIGTPASELDIDLGPIARRLSTPGTSLALLPVLSLGATWDVTLSSDRRPKSSSTTPVLLLATTTRSAEPPTTPTAAPTPSTVKTTGGAPLIATAPGPIVVGPQISEPPSGDVTAPQIAPSVTTALALPAKSHSFDYPVVFLVPLLVIAGLMAFGRQLTRPLTRDRGDTARSHSAP